MTLHPPVDTTRILSDEMYQALAEADLYPSEIAALDERGRFWRYLDRRDHPPFIDVSQAGVALRLVPAVWRTPSAAPGPEEPSALEAAPR